MRKLQDLGFLHCTEAGRVAIANDFFRRWLQRGGQTAPDVDSTAAAPVVDAASLSPAPSTSTGFFEELKRRKVFRVGLAYAAVAWLLLQLGEILFDLLDVPGWAGKLLVVALALGLLTPSGIRRDKDVDRPV